MCPFNKEHFCKKRVLSITSNGTCGHLYERDGVSVNPRWQNAVEERFKEGWKDDSRN